MNIKEFNFNKITNKFKHPNFKTLESSIKIQDAKEKKNDISNQHEIVFQRKYFCKLLKKTN